MLSQLTAGLKINMNLIEVDQHCEPRRYAAQKANVLAVTAVVHFQDCTTALQANVFVDGLRRIQSQESRHHWPTWLSTQISEIKINDEISVDSHHADQLLIYMALAKGQSMMRTTKILSTHTKTMIALLPMFDEKIKI